MSGSRKRDSKWNSGAFHDREPEHGYFSAEVGRKDKWSGVGVSDMMKSKHGLSSRGSLHGSRIGEKDDNNDFVKNWNTSTQWDRDDTYSMKMSPGLDDRGLKKHHSSPKGDWNRSHRHRSRSWSRSNSRSRSRSPVRGTRSQLGFHERSINRSEVSTQLCKEFMAGRCRRGSQCHFLHQDIQSREDGWDNRQKRAVASKYITHDDGKDNLIKSGRSSDCCTEYRKGNCRKGASCRFAHDGASDGFSRRQTHQISNERENTKRNRVRTPEREGEREVRRSGGDIPCTYFAAGNCRNGKYCRFSHHGQARASLERSRDDRGVWDSSSTSVNKLHDGSAMRDADASFNVNKSWNVPERSDANALNEAGIPWNGSKWSALDASNNVNNSWTGSKWSDADASNNVNNSWTGSKWSDADASNNVNNSLTGSKWSDADASNNVNNSLTGSKWSDADASNNVNNSLTGSKWSDANASNDVNNSRTGSKWSDAGAYSGATRLSKDTIGKKGVSEPRFSKWSVDERWRHEYDVSGKNIVANRQCKTVDIDKDEGIPRKIENAGVNMGASEPKGAEDPLADMEMSPEWNYRIQSSVKKEHSQSSRPAPVEVLLPAREKNITEEASGQVHHGLEALQPMLTEKSNIQQDHLKRGSSAVLLPCVSNALNSNSNSHIDLKFSTNIPPLPSFDQTGPSPSSLSYSNFNAVGQSQVAIVSNEITTSGTHNSLMFQEQANNNLNTGDTNILQGNSGSQSTQPMVSNEQLTQLTNLSASLAQLFGKGQQLPLLNGMQVNPSANSGDHVVLDSVPTVQPEQVTFPKQYDPVSDSIESGKKQGIVTKPLEILVDPVTEKNTADEQPELSANKLLVSSLLGSNNGDVYHNDHSLKREDDFNSHKPNQPQLAASSDVKEDDGVEETKKTEGENGPSENVDLDDKTDEGKKNKDDKGIRAFKFALVEFVKDLLKPTWKEGQIGKEAYKNIVKKVVDKVIATVQGTSIPQTPEKIDQYLSFSKPKLSKLVQAYVTKFQKS